MLSAILHDLRFAARALVRRPGFTLAVTVTLALGIGANTAVYSLVDATLLRGLPFPDGDRLVAVWSTVQRETEERREMSYPDFRDVAESVDGLDGVAAVLSAAWTSAGDLGAVRLEGEMVTPGYLAVLGVAPALGRTLSAETPDAAEAVIGHGLWQRRFGGDPGVLGQRLRLDDTEYTVVGVMPAGFSGLNTGSDVWVPLASVVPPQYLEQRGGRFLDVVARLADGATLEQARDEAAALGRSLEEQHADSNAAYGVSLGPLQADLMGDLETPLLVLSAVVVFVLLIACVNVANLMLVRASGRRRESAVHAALGAGRLQLLARSLFEAVLLSLAGGTLGVLLAAWGLNGLLGLSPVQLPDFVPVHVDLRVLGFSLLLALATAVMLGLLTARGDRERLADTLRPGVRGGTGSRSLRRTRGLLVAAEVALALVLLVGAGLMAASFSHLRRVEPGFDTANLMFFRVDLSATGWDDTQRAAFVPRLRDALAAVPGAESVALSTDTPLQQGWAATVLSPEGRAFDPQAPYGGGTRIYRHRVGPGFFATVGLPLASGRAFRPGDGAGEAPPVIVSEELARRTWPGTQAVGRRVKLGPPDSDQPWRTVIGVTADARYRRVPGDPDDMPDDPDVFFPLEEGAPRGLAVSVRSPLPPPTLFPELRRAVQRLDPAVAAFELQTPEERLAGQRGERRFTVVMMAVFAGLALLLAAVGVYGVVAYSVAERTGEIGVRMALGAHGSTVLGMVVRQGMVPVVLGLAAGLAMALVLARLLGSLLYEVGASDPAVYAVVSGALLAVALVASMLPARRASRVDPAIALRHE